MIIGYDDGNGFAKTSEGVIIPSKYTRYDTSFTTESLNIIKLNNLTYTVGTGVYSTNEYKFKDENRKVLMLTSLGLSSKDNNFQIVAGLPINQYKKYKNDYKHILLSNRVNNVELNGEDRVIIIDDVIVTAQCLGVYNSLPQEYKAKFSTMPLIIVDIGTGTTDISLVEADGNSRRITKYNTIWEGTLKLYNDIIHQINITYELDLKVENALDILRDGLYVYGEKVQLTFLKDIILMHFNEIIKELALNYPLKTGFILLSGGGAYLYNGLFKNMYKNTVIVPDSQLANAIGFKREGISKWQDE